MRVQIGIEAVHRGLPSGSHRRRSSACAHRLVVRLRLRQLRLERCGRGVGVALLPGVGGGVVVGLPTASVVVGVVRLLAAAGVVLRPGDRVVRHGAAVSSLAVPVAVSVSVTAAQTSVGGVAQARVALPVALPPVRAVRGVARRDLRQVLRHPVALLLNAGLADDVVPCLGQTAGEIDGVLRQLDGLQKVVRSHEPVDGGQPAVVAAQRRHRQ
mmetsp:Transcript_40058/g.87295  ORF Transcript_40058/g.87295 Transcript_40058/m.87295 type:complete len:213 (+) Transcript_40058:661-1299(+)